MKNQQANIETLQHEINHLIAQKQQLEALPKAISDPLKYAQSVAEKVSQSAPKLREIDSLITNLQSLIQQRQAESEAEQRRLKDEAEKAELQGILQDFKTIGERLDAIARIEAKTLLELRSLYEKKANRLYQLTLQSVGFEGALQQIDLYPLGEGVTPGLHHYGVLIQDNKVTIQRRSTPLKTLLGG